MPALPYHHPAAKVTAWVLICFAYFLAGKIGLGLASVNVSASPVWAPAGMAVALLLMFAPNGVSAQEPDPAEAPAAPLPPEVSQPAYEVFRIDDDPA